MISQAPSHQLQSFGSAGEVTGAISTGIVGLLRKHTGRGPTKAATRMSADQVTVTLADCLTKAEKQLASAGHSELVMHTRGALHDGMRADAVSLVEELTQREVSAYCTDQQLDPDCAVILFLLAPSPT